MDSNLPPSRTTGLRPMLLVGLGVVILAVTAGIVLHDRTVPPAPPETAGLARLAAPGRGPARPNPSAPGPMTTPSFDVVRVNPQGDAVMAGRAAPGSEVTISTGGTSIGKVQADQNGDWVFVPSTRLSPGSRELTLAERAPNGTETKGDRSVVLVVPPANPSAAQNSPGQNASGQTTPPLAVLTGPGAPPSVLTGPAPAAGAGSSLAIGAMEYDEHGEVRFSGSAPPGAAVRLYIDNHSVGHGVADQQGKWTLEARNALAAGDHHLRLDQVAPGGKVTARLERPFTREQMATVQLPAGQIEIRPGQNFWVIARRTYGQGTRYLVIFQANRQQIRDPNLIYPGQVIAVPTASSAPAMPASSSTSR